MDIRRAWDAELSDVQLIDRAAGQMFNEVGMPEVTGPLWPVEALVACQQAGPLWVITDVADRPAGFLLSDMVDGCLHVGQLSVDPRCARRGLGRALFDHAAEQAAAAGVPAMTPATFADVPWNAPYYLRCGFRVLDDAEVTAGLRAIGQREDSVGLDRWLRVCMRRYL